jgi:hypothetical protein
MKRNKGTVAINPKPTNMMNGREIKKAIIDII